MKLPRDGKLFANPQVTRVPPVPAVPALDDTLDNDHRVNQPAGKRPFHDHDFQEIQPWLFVATEEIGRPNGGLALAWYRCWRALVGRPIPTSRSIHERLGKIQALAVLSSDALSSVAYGPEQVFIPLMLAGYAAMRSGLWIALAIAALMVIVGLSYRQTIRGYPNGGGSYIVAKDNLGTFPGLVAAASLLLDYVLTVSVSVSAGVAAITSAFPELFDDRVIICLAFVVLMTVGNLRGVRESGAIFAAPTYVFIVTMYGFLLVGFAKVIMAGGAVQPLPHGPVTAVEGLTLFLVLRAFASGCSAMTGLEAISNGVPAFKRPEAENARATLTWMVGILMTMFLGTMFLALIYQAVPKPDGSETMVSLMARGIIGTGPFYYLLQASTAMILILGANTSYADFPRLASLLARDRFLPKLFTFRGDRLAFNTGILALSLFSALLVVHYAGITDALIPIYAIGVFISFTLSQSGMVRHWWRIRDRGWRTALIINGIGALSTGVVAVVVTTAKFAEGAWIAVLIIPCLIGLFLAIHHHYNSVWKQLSVSDLPPQPLPAARSDNLEDLDAPGLLVPMGNVNKATLQTLRYALSLSPRVTVIHVSDVPEDVERFCDKLKAWWPKCNVVVIESPYRALVGPLVAYLDDRRAQNPDTTLTVVIPEFIVAHWWEHLLHNQTALRLKTALLFRKGVAVTSVPFHLW